MRSTSTAMVLACALLACALSLPPAAAAAAVTAPQLKAPAADGARFTTGESMQLEWTGALQGDPDTLARSFFRIEVIAAKDMPGGSQVEWPVAKLENFAQTEPGQTVTSTTLGVPMAGEYRWRVCAWGVTDDLVANVLERLEGGCSASRSFTTVAASRTRGAIGELPIETRKQVDGGVRKVFVERPAAPEPAAEPELDREPIDVTPAPEPVAPTTVQEIERPSLDQDGSALDLGADVLHADASADREGLGGALMTGLTLQLPFLPIPFWTLAILIACIPIARVWRRSVQAMFEWPDGSIDGKGTPLASIDLLHDDADAQGLQIRSKTADGEATDRQAA